MKAYHAHVNEFEPRMHRERRKKKIDYPVFWQWETLVLKIVFDVPHPWDDVRYTMRENYRLFGPEPSTMYSSGHCQTPPPSSPSKPHNRPLPDAAFSPNT